MTDRQSIRPPLIDRLRAGTRAHHEHVERRLAGDGAWSRRRYAELLRMSYSVIAPVEGVLSDRLGEVFAVPPPGSRVDRLRADLAELGWEVAPVAVDAVAVSSQAEAFGVGYVLQGSLLGGAIIARQARADCGDPVIPTRYLSLYGTELGLAWRRFCAAANAFGDDAPAGEHRRAVAAAIDTFAAHEAALDALA